MSQINRTANHCDVCGHDWLPTSGIVYTHCTSGKCRSRKWNQSVNSQGAAHRKGGEITTGSTKGAVAQPDRALAKEPEAVGSIPTAPIKPNMQALREICAGKAVTKAEFEMPYLNQPIEIPICGKRWWEDGTQYECLMDKGHREQKHGLRAMVRRIDE